MQGGGTNKVEPTDLTIIAAGLIWAGRKCNGTKCACMYSLLIPTPESFPSVMHRKPDGM
jgi:hypothetical protein